jgi:hypothetical protein
MPVTTFGITMVVIINIFFPLCHSEHLWNPENGKILNPETFEKLLLKYSETITCVIFMGGEWSCLELLILINIVKKISFKSRFVHGFE